jgi:nucleotide-binding universal stress UspA family protein
MFTTAIVPFDGSPLSARALPYALRLARAGTRLVLVRGYLTQDAELSFAAHYPYLPARERERLEYRRAQAEFTAAVERFTADHDRAVSSSFVEGRPADVILEVTRSTQADVIVMATHGRTGLVRSLLGSVADEVVRRAHIPVLLVPSATTHDWAGAERPMRLLVPLDGSSLAAEALGPAAELASRLDADLVLLGVVEPDEAVYPDALVHLQTDVIQQRSEASAYLEAVATDLRSRLSVSVQVSVAHGHAAETIRRAADQNAVDAIVMATHGRGGLTRLVLGSVATATLQRAHLPLLLCRPMSAHPEALTRTRAGENVR